jgi:hypothetical protein
MTYFFFYSWRIYCLPIYISRITSESRLFLLVDYGTDVHDTKDGERAASVFAGAKYNLRFLSKEKRFYELAISSRQ